jgi:serine/threonine protein kinase/tetratricopeptide (TPR) repeat protein
MIEEELFHRALEKPTLAEQLAFLDEVCPDQPELRQRVERLLRSHRHEDSFLHPGVTVDQPATEAAGTVIGPYKLLQQLGEGGMGTVFLAEQSQPVQRKVALKLIKSGMDSQQVLARFEAERQALALMDHPNIARVLDAGTTEGSRPYFVMELVKGVPITRYCDERRLTPQQRLELFVPVCQAVQHAHQKGIIHRDLKPSNVLVCLYDGKPVPKVIDFGVAKAAGPKLTEKTLFTEVGSVVGTLEYMSPEQAELNQLDIDTRSDIYSLGVLLYELLTGTTPLERKRFKEAAFLEVLRLIREEESPRPSTRLSTAEGLPSIAANRGLEPKKLSGLVRGELDWIVMKALDKERNRRYETANGFAADVLRYLNDEPVQACPPAAGYRLRKFVRRNRGPVLAATVIFLLSIVGTIGTSWGLWRANLSEAQARDEATKAGLARDEERQAKETESSARQRAEDSRDRAAAALDAMTSEIAGDALSQQKVITPAQKRFLSSALEYYQELLKEESNDPATRQRVAAVAQRIGMIEYQLGRTGVGIAVSRRARDLYLQLAAEFRDVAEYRRRIVHCHNLVGILLEDLGKAEEAVTEFRTGLARAQQLATEFPGAAYRHDLAQLHSNLAGALGRLRQHDEAMTQVRAAIDLDSQLVSEFPDNEDYLLDLGNHHSTLARQLADRRAWGQAVAEFRAALDLRKQLVARKPFNPTSLEVLAIGHNNLGNVLALGLQKPEEAEPEYRAALAIRRKLVADFPTTSDYALQLGGVLCNLGRLVGNQGRVVDALALFDEAIATLTAVVAHQPRHPLAREFLFNGHWGRAEGLDFLKRHDKAAQDWARALPLAPADRHTVVRTRLMDSRARAGQWAAALKDADELAGGDPRDLLYDCACVYALAHASTRDDAQALRAVELLRRAVAKGYRDVTHMKEDADLDSIRHRADFKKLLAELQKN